MIEPIILNNANTSIKKIYHISDLHLRRYERHIEYEHVFNNLYKYLEENVNDHSIIVITGDIMHSKDNLTPDSVIKCYKLLKSLANIMPVIMILGNHDMVETNKTIKDSLSAILAEHNIENLYYLRDSGAYKYGNIIFGVSSLYDGKFIKANTIKLQRLENEILIGLYHGPVGKCETGVGILLNGDKKPSDFDNYDYVLLGDIHKFQFIKENIAYASSLISQNFAETDKYHGVLVWDLENKKTEYKIIDNPYRHMMADIINGLMIIDDIEIDYEKFIFPTNAKIRLNIVDTNKELCDKIKKKIRKRYPNIIFYETIIHKDNKNEIEINNYVIDYKKMLESFIDKMDDIEQNECRQIFMKYIDELNLSVERQLCNWELLDIEFSNMFAYGENNKLDFTKLPYNDIVGLFAPNSHGKSTLIDIILFSLYENFSRNVYSIHKTIPSYIVNNTKNWFETKIRFKLGNEIYTIHKKGSLVGKFKSKTGKSITFSENRFYKELNGTIIDLTRKDRFETQKEVNNIIGTYDDFCLTTLFLQNGEKNFYDMKTGERKEFLFNILNLDKFDKMYNIFKNEEKEAKFKKDELEKNINSLDIDDILSILDELKKNIKKLNKKNEMLIDIKKKINKKRTYIIKKLNNENYNSPLINYDLKITDIKWLENNLDICKMIINDYKIYEVNEFNYYNFSQMLYSIKEEPMDMDINKILIKIKDYNKILLNENIIINNYQKYKENIMKKEQIDYKLKLVNEQIKENNINHKCHICLQRKHILDDYIKQKDLLEEELNYIIINEEWLINYNEFIKIKDEYKILLNNYNSYRKQLCIDIINHYSNNNYNKEEQHKTLNKLKEYMEYLIINIKYVKNNENINLLNYYDNKLEIIDTKINNNNTELNKYTYDYAKNYTNYEYYNKCCNERKLNDKKYNIYSALKKASHINGVPSKIISTRLNDVEIRVNELISQFINKKVNVLLDGNNILVHIKDSDNNIINILGGMEMFLINIAFKISLANVSIIPKNKMLIIDEGVSVLDKNHIERFDKIAMFLNSNYNHVILISHIDSLKDFISHYITISKDEQQLSNISYN